MTRIQSSALAFARAVLARFARRRLAVMPVRRLLARRQLPVSTTRPRPLVTLNMNLQLMRLNPVRIETVGRVHKPSDASPVRSVGQSAPSPRTTASPRRQFADTTPEPKTSMQNAQAPATARVAPPPIPQVVLKTKQAVQQKLIPTDAQHIVPTLFSSGHPPVNAATVHPQPIDLDRLTQRVIAGIDARILAQRERLGKP